MPEGMTMTRMMSWPEHRGVVLALTIGLMIPPNTASAQRTTAVTPPGLTVATAQRDETRPAILTATAIWLVAAGAAGMVAGMYFGLEPETCVQMTTAGQCLRTRVPSEDGRLSGFALAGFSTVVAIFGGVTAFIADTMWRALPPGPSRDLARFAPWIYADGHGAMGGAGVSW
jgi:hypothetical protein